MKIVIKNLNNERDYVINTEDKCNIFVGNNGCGKSTAMKILFYLLKNDMRLLNYCFDEIEISNDSPRLLQIVKYIDILPSIDLYKNLYLKNKMIYFEPRDKNEDNEIAHNLSNKEILKKYSSNIFTDENKIM